MISVNALANEGWMRARSGEQIVDYIFIVTYRQSKVTEDLGLFIYLYQRQLSFFPTSKCH